MLFTDKQTNRQTNATKNITSFAKEVIIMFILSPKIPESSVDFTNDLRIQHTYRSNRKLKACKGIIT